MAAARTFSSTGRALYLARLVARIVFAFALFAPPSQAGEQNSEAAIEAAYLYKFAPFVTWPGARSRPLTICVLGAEAFADILTQTVAGQTFEDRPIQVVEVATIGSGSSCDIAYLDGSPRQSVENALRAVRGAPILTVTNDNDPAGMIDFTVQAGRVRFRIDQDAAHESGLTFSSKLLSLALTVKTSSDGAR